MRRANLALVKLSFKRRGMFHVQEVSIPLLAGVWVLPPFARRRTNSVGSSFPYLRRRTATYAQSEMRT